MPHDVLAVANEWLERGRNVGTALTPMHLQKLCYMANGFSLAFLDGPLIRDQVEAWAYGPVYKRLYDAVKKYGSGAVEGLIHERNWAIVDDRRGEIVREPFSISEQDLLKSIFDTYAGFPAFQLSALTHEDGSPWKEVYSGGENKPIPNDKMRDYFRGLATAA